MILWIGGLLYWLSWDFCFISSKLGCFLNKKGEIAYLLRHPCSHFPTLTCLNGAIKTRNNETKLDYCIHSLGQRSIKSLNQCDQMFSVLAFYDNDTLFNSIFCQNRFKNGLSPQKWQNFCRIWSHWSKHTKMSKVTKVHAYLRLIQILQPIPC